MSYPSAYYTEAQRIIDKRRFDNGMISTKRYNEIREKLPEAAALFSRLSETTDRLVKIIIAHPENIKEQIEQLKNENLEMQDRLAETLTKNGYPADYLDEIYTCKICKDTGLDEKGRCKCFNDVLKQIAARELSRSLPIGLTCFESFNLKYYSDTPKPELNGWSVRNIMQKNYEYCKDYAENFILPYDSIFMTGGTGLGKTHLSLSIAKKVTELGFSVVYGSVPDLLRKIENAHFNRREDENDVFYTIKDCDLLVLDDLGAEFDSPFYVSCLYDIINTRLNFGRPTIVNSNFSTAEIKKRYSDRIASRLLSMKCLLFSGEDIRVQLKQAKS